MEKGEKIQAETIITSHINADFDAVASMLAAQKLYPGSVVIFPGSQEKNLRNFFISSMSYLFNMADASTIDFSCTKKLVLVDTKQIKRITAVSELMARDDIEIHIYDHHPSLKNDIKGDFELIRFTGSTVTILSELIRKRQIKLSSEEATIMALGIYEDTGSFTYASTTEDDFREAGFLLSCGASLNTIASLVAKEISPDQITWLNDLLNEITCHRINGFDVNISSISSPGYITDLASIVQKVVKMNHLDLFFAIVLMGNKITIVARSRIPEADVGKITSFLGGGGHSYAASANLSNTTLAQAEQRLLELIKREVHPSKITKELMSSPAITIQSNVKCKEASIIMTRYNVNALLVSGKNKNDLKGYITRQVIEKTLYHNLEDLPVSEYMSTDMSFISPDSDIPEIEGKIIEGKQRIVPVMDKDKIVGVVTRTDLLNFLVQRNKEIDSSERGKTNANRHAKKRNIINFINERLAEETIQLLKKLGKAGDDLGINIFVVGGFVRDLLLYKKNDDIDIVVEGDGIAFARRFATMMNGRCSAHRKFGTAVITIDNNFKLDVASARLEYYKFPAALPTVEMSSIKLDLFRRDFTINTLAISLNHDNFGTLIDFFGAQRDLKDKVIRIIHNLSFVEDPTRVFRAIRFANRYDFTIGKLTSSLIKNTIKLDFLKKLSGLRLFSELKQILEEDNPVPAIESLKEYNLEKIMHPELVIDKETINTMESVKKALAWHDLLYFDKNYLRWSVYFMIIIKKLPINFIQEICSRLKFSPKYKKLILNDRLKADERLCFIANSSQLTNSALYDILSIFKTELILYMMASARDEKTKKAISYFYTQLKDTKVLIGGQDLISLGLKPGPFFREIMQMVLKAKLDGLVETKEDEMEFVVKYLSDRE